MLRCVLLFLILALAAHAQVPIGASKKEVIDTLGWPKSTSTAGTREVLYYPEYSVLIADGRVEKLQFNPKDGKLPNTYSPPVIIPKRGDKEANPSWAITPKEIPLITPEEQLGPRPIQNPPPQPRTQQQKQPATYVAPSNVAPSPRPTSQNPEKTRQIVRPPVSHDTLGSVVFRNLTPWALLFGVILILKLIFGKKLERKSLEMRDELARTITEPERRALGLPPRPIARPDSLRDGWSLELLKTIEWHRFEQVVAEYHRLLGNRAELTTFGADGGIDVEIYRPAEPTPFLLIQCKAWANEPVGVALTRELFGVAAARRIPGTAFHTTSSYTSDARIFADSVNMELVDGPDFIARIKSLPLSSQIKLHEFATAGDYTTPTCANCTTKMVLRTARQGRNAGNDFWACTTCRNTINIRRA